MGGSNVKITQLASDARHSGARVESSSGAFQHVRAATLERIHHFLSKPELRVYRDLKGMCERVSDTYRDRVVIELLQNAHDAHPAGSPEGRVRIALDPEEGEHGTLYVANDGSGFTEANVDALCSPTLTTKHVNEAIGNKGVGFLSVFQVSSHPEVYSRRSAASTTFDGFCFAFAADATLHVFLTREGLGNQAAQVIASMPRLYLACPSAFCPDRVQKLADDGFATVIRLPLKSADALTAVERQLAILSTEAPPVQLFLTRIRELTVSADPATEATVLKRDCAFIARRDDLRILRVDCGRRSYVVAEKVIPYETVIEIIRRDIAAEALPDTWEEWTGDALVSVAVAADGEPLLPRLYNFLPMGDGAEAPFAGYLDAPFLATVDRLRVQGGVELNSFFMDAARDLAVGAATLVRTSLPRREARQVVADLVLWKKKDDPIRERVLTSSAALVPTIPVRKVSDGWATFGQARLWQGDDFLSPQYVSRYAGFPIVDPELGISRLRELRGFVEGTGLLHCSATTRAQIVEDVAGRLPRPPRGLERWNSFYRSLAKLFRDDQEALAGRRLLLPPRGDIERTETSKPLRGRRRRRLTAIFLPPLRGAGSEAIATALPKAVQRRLSFMHPDLELATDGTSAARRFFLASGLVREHESREILRLLAGAIADPGEARDPEGLRWDALTAMMRIVAAEDTAESVVSEINPQVPTLEGWSRASLAYFSARWPETQGSDLEALFERAVGISAELDLHGRRLLRRYADWPVSPNERDKWVAFLRKAGVTDLLRPVPAIAGPAPREYPATLQAMLVQRSGLPSEQRTHWTDLMGPGWAVTNPQTIYTSLNLFRLPGQLDHAALAAVVAQEYAQQVIRLIEASPAIFAFTIFRPLHPHQPNTRSWPSPVAAFVRAAAWIPLTSGKTVGIRAAWLPGLDSRTPPPLLPLASLEFRQELARHPRAAEALRNAGLAEYGTRAAAWRFLEAAGELVTSDTSSGAAERLLVASQDAWQQADLERDPPPGLRLVGRRCGKIVSEVPTAAAAGPFLVADGDDRQMVAASARADPATIIVEPPTARAREIGAYLAKHFPAAIRRASDIRGQYECEGKPVSTDAADSTLIDALGDPIRQVVALTLRYRSIYRGSPEETLARLAAIRIRKLPSLSLKIGDISQPVPRFEERAVLLGSASDVTILYSEALAQSDRLLVGLAPAIGAALGAQRIVGEPLLAFAAELGPHALESSYDDYAAVLNVPVEEIKGTLGAAQASIGNLLRTLRPLVHMFAGEAEAARFVPGSGLVSEEDVIGALERARDHLSVGAVELVRRCRESDDLGAIAIALRLDLARLNAAIAKIGPPYTPVDLTDRHEAALTAYIGRNELLIRESIRESFRPQFERGESLAAYVQVRGAQRPGLPSDYGLMEVELSPARMGEWLSAWMAGLGVQPRSQFPPARSQRDAVRDANLKQLRSLVPELRTALLARTAAEAAERKMWGSVAEAEASVSTAALSAGWADFDRLDERQALYWLRQSKLWPADLAGPWELAITDAEREERRQQDERARIAATTVKRQMQYSGGVFTFGVDAMGSLADRITTLVSGNAPLLNSSSRTLRGQAPEIRRSSGGGGGRGGGGSTRMTDEERNLVGFFGEAIAFEWLKRKFGAKRIVDEACWKSAYRIHVCGEPGNDSLGYDFEVVNGRTTWMFEVKSTTAAGPSSVQSLELGPSEFRRAEACKADRRSRYRILYVTDALHPENARIFPLPNPRSRDGLAFFTDLHAGHRLYFPLTP